MYNRLRTCIGCRRVAPSDQLIRVVATAAGELRVGPGTPGRGAWLCQEEAGTGIRLECLKTAKARRSFERALRTPVLPESVEALHTREETAG